MRVSSRWGRARPPTSPGPRRPGPWGAGPARGLPGPRGAWPRRPPCSRSSTRGGSSRPGGVWPAARRPLRGRERRGPAGGPRGARGARDTGNAGPQATSEAPGPATKKTGGGWGVGVGRGERQGRSGHPVRGSSWQTGGRMSPGWGTGAGRGRGTLGPRLAAGQSQSWGSLSLAPAEQSLGARPRGIPAGPSRAKDQRGSMPTRRRSLDRAILLRTEGTEACFPPFSPGTWRPGDALFLGLPPRWTGPPVCRDRPRGLPARGPWAAGHRAPPRPPGAGDRSDLVGRDLAPRLGQQGRPRKARPTRGRPPGNIAGDSPSGKFERGREWDSAPFREWGKQGLCAQQGRVEPGHLLPGPRHSTPPPQHPTPAASRSLARGTKEPTRRLFFQKRAMGTVRV